MTIQTQIQTTFVVAALLFAQMAVSSMAIATPIDADLQWQKAMQLARIGKPWRDTPELRSHPLYVYVEHVGYARNTQKLLDDPSFWAWLKKNDGDMPLIPGLRKQLMDRSTRGSDWQSYVRLFRELDADPTARCYVWQARMKLAPDEARGIEHAQRLYRDHQTPALPCAAAFDFLRGKNLTEADASSRFASLLDARRISDAKSMLQDLPAVYRPRAELLLKAESDAFTFVKQLPFMPPADFQAEATTRALKRIAAANPAFAVQKLTSLGKKYFSASQHAEVRGAAIKTELIADTPTMIDHLRDNADAIFDDQGHEWAIRRSLQAQDFVLLKTRTELLPSTLANQSKWLYIKARQFELAGQAADAGRHYQQAAKEANFYGFLAADRIQTGYALCADPEVADANIVKKIALRPAMQRIAAFQRMNDRVGAKREWMYLLQTLSSTERRQAGLMAAREGWGEFAVLALNQPENRRLYTARFPILEVQTLNQESKRNGLDPYFVAGLIRQESAWNPTAVSRANARGLMQLLPSTAALTAKAIGQPGQNINLFDPAKNIQLGTAHLTELSQRYANSPILMTAAYNAGPNAVKRWVNDLYRDHPDLWVETVPYRETRDYISAVLAFSVIYDWRIDGKITRLSHRIPELAMGKLSNTTVEQNCPKPQVHDAIGGR